MPKTVILQFRANFREGHICKRISGQRFIICLLMHWHIVFFGLKSSPFLGDFDFREKRDVLESEVRRVESWRSKSVAWLSKEL